MIEQTDLVVTEWDYHPPALTDGEKISSTIELEVMKKTARLKKGIACRFTCIFNTGSQTILKYVTEDSYVIDLEDKIDSNELRKMIANSYSKCKDRFELRKLGTVLQGSGLRPFDENKLDVDSVLPLLEL